AHQQHIARIGDERADVERLVARHRDQRKNVGIVQDRVERRGIGLPPDQRRRQPSCIDLIWVGAVHRNHCILLVARSYWRPPPRASICPVTCGSIGSESAQKFHTMKSAPPTTGGICAPPPAGTFANSFQSLARIGAVPGGATATRPTSTVGAPA